MMAALLLGLLAEAAVRSLGLALFVGLLLRLVRRRTSLLELVAWRGVLLMALLMPALTSLLPTVPLALPLSWLPPAGTASGPLPVDHLLATGAVPPPSASVAPPPASSLRGLLGLTDLLPGLYLGVATYLTLRWILGLLLAHRLRRRAQVITDETIASLLGERPSRPGRKCPPVVLASTAVTAPVTVGLWRAAILLPADWHKWDPNHLRAVLVHEASHARRRDPLILALAELHRAWFWFSPLPWWLKRKIALLAEQASDEAVLAAGVEKAAYAALLLDTLAATQAMRGRVHWATTAMARPLQLEQRVDRILHAKKSVSPSASRLAGLGLALVVVFSTFLVAGLRPVARPAPNPIPAALLAEVKEKRYHAPPPAVGPSVPQRNRNARTLARPNVGKPRVASSHRFAETPQPEAAEPACPPSLAASAPDVACSLDEEGAPAEAEALQLRLDSRSLPEIEIIVRTHLEQLGPLQTLADRLAAMPPDWWRRQFESQQDWLDLQRQIHDHIAAELRRIWPQRARPPLPPAVFYEHPRPNRLLPHKSAPILPPRPGKPAAPRPIPSPSLTAIV